MRTLTPFEFQPTVRIANYFAALPGAAWCERTIPDYELILVVSGRFAYATEALGERWVGPGHVLCIPPLEHHSFRRVDHSKRAVLSCIHGEVIQDGSRGAGDYVLNPAPQVVTDVRGEKSIQAAFKRCSEVFNEYGPYRRVLLEAVALEIWVRLAARWGRSGNGIGEGKRGISLRAQRMVDFLKKNLCEPISRRDLADAFHLTPEHINAIFKRELGISPTGFIHRERVLRAYNGIRDEGWSVKEAAARVGFSDPFYFSRVFKRIMSESPGHVRS